MSITDVAWLAPGRGPCETRGNAATALIAHGAFPAQSVQRHFPAHLDLGHLVQPFDRDFGILGSVLHQFSNAEAPRNGPTGSVLRTKSASRTTVLGRSAPANPTPAQRYSRPSAISQPRGDGLGTTKTKSKV
jgi:hypothetical protein